MPDEATYDSYVKPRLKAYCGSCHSSPPTAGAPFSVLSYDALLASYMGKTVFERVGLALEERRMPPLGAPQLTDHDREHLIEWARCNFEEHSDGGFDADAGVGGDDGLGASREPITASDTPPAGTTPIDITLDEFNPPALGDHYETRSFTNLVGEDMFVRYMQPVIDDGRVVHHLTVRFGKLERYLYVWAPGTQPFEFPDGGIRLKPEDELLLEVHYSNGIGDPDVRDSSGVRIFLDTPGGTEYGVANLGTWDILVPPGGSFTATAKCRVPEKTHVLASIPHMHHTGTSIAHTIKHLDGSTEDLISLARWNFHRQTVYSIGVDLKPLDQLILQCEYTNPTNDLVTAGVRSEDEMCMNFMYVTPPRALERCHQ